MKPSIELLLEKVEYLLERLIVDEIAEMESQGDIYSLAAWEWIEDRVRDIHLELLREVDDE